MFEQREGVIIEQSYSGIVRAGNGTHRCASAPGPEDVGTGGQPVVGLILRPEAVRLSIDLRQCKYGAESFQMALYSLRHILQGSQYLPQFGNTKQG